MGGGGGKKGGGKAEIAKFYLSLLMGVSWGPVHVLRSVYYGDKLMIGTHVTEGRVMNVDERKLHGGKKREGGPVGAVTFMPGTRNQLLPTFMADKIYGDVPENSPGFRNICCLAITEYQDGKPGYLLTGANHLHFSGDTTLEDARKDNKRGKWSSNVADGVGHQISTNNPFLKGFWAEVSRASNDWYPEKAAIYRTDADQQDFINGQTIQEIEGKFDSNGVHIAREAMTNADWGMSAAPWAFDDASWRRAADIAFEENLGLSFLWKEQMTIESFVQMIANHCRFAIFPDPYTGLISIEMMRNNYDPDSLPVLDATNSELIDPVTRDTSEVVNEVIAKWTNPENNKEEAVYAQNLASIADAGELISETHNYKLFRRQDLAERAASRDVFLKTAPVRSGKIKVAPNVDLFRPGQVLVAHYPESGFHRVVMRVGDVDTSPDTGSSQTLTVLEDIFASEATETTEGSFGERPSLGDRAITNTRIETAPYYLIARNNGDYKPGDEYFGLLAAVNRADIFSIEVYRDAQTPSGNAELTNVVDISVSRYGTLNEQIEEESITEPFVPPSDFSPGAGLRGDVFLIFGPNDGLQEIALLSAYTGRGAGTLWRGLLDTVPRRWPAGTEVWVMPASFGRYGDPEDFTAGVTKEYTFDVQFADLLQPDDSTAVSKSHTLIERADRPLRPANVRVNGYRFAEFDDAPYTEDTTLTVTWANRNRITEDFTIIRWNEGDEVPEEGQETLVLLVSVPELQELDRWQGTGTTATVNTGGHVGRVFVETHAVRDGIRSLTSHRIYLEAGQAAPPPPPPPDPDPDPPSDDTLNDPFVTNGAYFSHGPLPANTEMWRLEVKVKLKQLVSGMGFGAQHAAGRLRWMDDGAYISLVEDSTGASLGSTDPYPISVDEVMTLVAEHDLAAGTLKLFHNGVLVRETPITSSTSVFQTRNMLTAAGANANDALPPDTEAEYFKLFYRSVGGSEQLFDEISVAAQGSVQGINDKTGTIGTVLAP